MAVPQIEILLVRGMFSLHTLGVADFVAGCYLLLQ